jgi:hypothetical protein
MNVDDFEEVAELGARTKCQTSSSIRLSAVLPLYEIFPAHSGCSHSQAISVVFFADSQ